MKILVTGAYGQLGNEIKELGNRYPNWKLLFTDVDSLDITNEKSVQTFFSTNKPDAVINCAAYTAVDKSETEQELAEKINALAVKILAGVSKKFSAKLIHVSTDYVFNGQACVPYSEEDNVNPQGIYGKTKLLGEQYCREENPDSVIIRTSWLYSAFGNNFVKTMLRLGTEREELNVVFDQVGTPTYAADLAESILKILEIAEKDPKKFVPGIYHFSNEGVASWYDFAYAIFGISGVNCNVSPVLSDQFPTPAKRPAYSVLNKSKIKNTFDLKIPHWKESLEVCLDKIKNNKSN
ncbi:MAG: dTDP-4-dehydrorhamnose reductase [Bacteroidota bacterium]